TVEHNFDIKINYTNDLLILKRPLQHHLIKNINKHKQYRLHYVDVMTISFILDLIMSDIKVYPSVTYKYTLRCCVYLLILEQLCCCSIIRDKIDLTNHETLETNEKLYEMAVQSLDLDSLLEFLEQLRVLSITQLPKEDGCSPSDLFPTNIIIDKLGEMTIGTIVATHKDIGIAKRAISHMHTQLRSYLSVRPEYQNFHMNEEFFKPFEHLICTEQCDSVVENQIVNSICELVELNTNNIKSGWRSVFACLKTVKIEQKRRNIYADDGGKENKEADGIELHRINALLEVLEAFFNCDNLNVIASAAIDCLLCLFRYLREPDPWTPMQNSPFDESDEEDSHDTDMPNQIEMVMPALNMMNKFMTIFIHCYASPSSPSRHFESTSFTYCTFINYSTDFFTHISSLNKGYFTDEFKKTNQQEQIMDFLQMFERNLQKDVKYLSLNLDSIDKNHLLSVWSYMIEGLTDTIFSCSNRYIIKIIDHYFEILKVTLENVNYQFSIYLIVCVIIPWLQSFVCSNFLKKTSLRKMSIFRCSLTGQQPPRLSLTAWRLFMGNLLEHVIQIFDKSSTVDEYHHILFDTFLSMLNDWLVVPNEYVGRLGISCIKHLLTNLTAKFDSKLSLICCKNIRHALLLTSLPIEYIIHEFNVSSADDLLLNVRLYTKDASLSTPHDNDNMIFLLCKQLFNEQSTSQSVNNDNDRKLFRFTFRSSDNKANMNEIDMQTFVFSNYFHIQLIHIIGEILLNNNNTNFTENSVLYYFLSCLAYTIDLCERYETNNIGLKCLLQQLFSYEIPVTFYHLKRIAFQYLIDLLLKNIEIESVELWKQDSLKPNEMNHHHMDKTITLHNEDSASLVYYTSFPQSGTPTDSPKKTHDLTINKGFFSNFSSYLYKCSLNNSANQLVILKMLSDGIADTIYKYSNEYETRMNTQNEDVQSPFYTVTAKITYPGDNGLYLLRADQDLIDKFIPDHHHQQQQQQQQSNSKQQNSLNNLSVNRNTNISKAMSPLENETQYFIVTEDMINQALNEYKQRKSEPSVSPLRKISSSSTSIQRERQMSSPSSAIPRSFSAALMSSSSDESKINQQQIHDRHNSSDLGQTLHIHHTTYKTLMSSMKLYIDGWNSLCLYLAKYLHSSNEQRVLLPVFERWLFILATNASNRELKNILLDMLVNHGKEKQINMNV
ncbi:unnamed protein product, partial [Didymodactylos carnosus]